VHAVRRSTCSSAFVHLSCTVICKYQFVHILVSHVMQQQLPTRTCTGMLAARLYERRT